VDEATKKIIGDTRTALAVCTENLCSLIKVEADAVETDKALRALTTAIGICQRLQGLESGSASNPYVDC